MKSHISIHINGTTHQVEPGISVAAALARCGYSSTRISVSGEARAPLCGMGVCQECRLTINHRPHQLACQTMCVQDLVIDTGPLS